MRDVVKAFGVKEFTRLTSEHDRCAEEIKVLGYTILADVLSESELCVIRENLDRIYDIQVQEIGGEDELHKINDARTARCLLVYDALFLGVATNPRVLSMVANFLGDYFTLMLQNGLLNIPGKGAEQNAGSWHRDLNYQHFVSTRPLSISALFCIDDFSEDTGGTYVLPASHKSEPFPSQEFAARHEKVIDARAGSVLVFDSMLFHRGGLNRSNRTRRAINHMYTSPMIKQQISLPRMLGGKYKDDPFLSKFLGYESEPAESATEFRKARIARIKSISIVPSVPTSAAPNRFSKPEPPSARKKSTIRKKLRP